MKSRRVTKSIKNLVFNVIQQIVGIATGFLIPPLIISGYGSNINGLISTIKQFVQYAQITGYGIATSGTYALYKPIANEDHRSISGIFNACKKMFNKSGNILSCIIVLMSVIYPALIHAQINYFTVFCLVIIIGSWGASEFYFIGKYQALLSADQKNYMVALAQMLGNIFNIVVTIILVKLKYPIIIVELGATVVYLTRVILLVTYVKKNYKYLDKKIKPMYEKVSQRGDAIVHEVTALIVNSSSVILISLMLGLKCTSVYSVYLLIFAGLNTICSIVSNGIYASFGDVIAKKENDVLQKSYDIFEYVYMIMIFVVYAATFILLMPFIKLYTVNMTDAQYVLPLTGTLFVILGLINNIKIPARTLVIAAGKFKETKKYTIIEMITNIVAQIIFIIIWGLNGAIIGCIVSALYRAINFIWYTNKEILHISHRRSIKRVCVYSIVGIIIMISYSIFFKNIIIANYIEWIKLGIISTMIISIIYLLISVIVDRNVLKESIKLIKSLFLNNSKE